MGLGGARRLGEAVVICATNQFHNTAVTRRFAKFDSESSEWFDHVSRSGTTEGACWADAIFQLQIVLELLDTFRKPLFKFPNNLTRECVVR